MQKIDFQNGTKVSPAKVTIDGIDHEVTPAVYSGQTPLTSYILNLMQENMEEVQVPQGGLTGQILAKNSDDDNDVGWAYNKAGDTFTAGAISGIADATTEIPQDWLLCNGQAVSRTTYADLFDAIGTSYGSGDGSTTFNVPTIATSNNTKYIIKAKNTEAELDYTVAENRARIIELETLADTELDTAAVEGTEIDVSDSAEYRGKIEVKGNTEQKQLSGKNLWGGFDYSRTNNEVAFSYNQNGTININGTANGTAISITATAAANYIKTLSAGQYCLSHSDLPTGVVVNLIKYDNGNVSIIKTGAGAFTLTEETSVYIRVEVNNNTVNNQTIQLQIEIGSTATDWEEYCGGQASPNPDYPQNIEVVTGDNVIKHVGKNLFDKDNANIIKAYINTTNSTIVANNNARCIYISVKPNRTYTVSRLAGQRFVVISISDYAPGTVGTSISYNQTASNLTITTGVNDKYLVIFYYLSTADTLTEEEIRNSIQIEENSIVTPYESHKEEDYNLNLGNIELCKTGDYQDILFKNVVGDENYNSSLVENAWYKKNAINKTTDQSGSTGITINDMVSDADFYSYYGGTISGKTIAYDSAISGTNTIYYPLNEATYTQITNPTLISQLEALNKAKWFKGVNHWFTETENLEPVLKGTYKQSNNLRIQALEQAIVALGGV